MTPTTGFELAFAVAVVVAAASLAAAALGRVPRLALLALTGLLAAGAVAAWVVFALDPKRELAVAAGGLTATVAVELAALGIRRGIARGRRLEEQFAAAEARLGEVIAHEAEKRGAELERTLARARADSISLLAEQERRIAEERRTALAEREDRAAAELTESLALVEGRIEQRLADWAHDLDRAQESFRAQLDALVQRQRELVSQAEARLEADSEQLKSASDEQRAAIARLREQGGKAVQAAAESARQELETSEAERRRALHEVSERLRQRERELRERVAAEETEATRRIEASFGDIERRQLDQFRRLVERTAGSLSEGAVQQFAEAVRSAREDAARRLSRELDRGVANFAREAQTVLAERLAQVADAGAQRVERRLSQITASLERRREEFLRDLERRLAHAEAELREQMQAIAADAEAERGVLDARLHDLARRVDETVAHASPHVSAGVNEEV
jgi:hypothetical protein